MNSAGFLLLAVAMPCVAKDLYAGFKAGIPATEYFDTGQTPTSYYSAATRRYTFGPTIEARLSNRFGLEADVLFKRTGYVAVVRGAEQTTNLDSKGDSWDVPIMAKYRFGRPLHPFVAAGAVLRYIGPIRARGEIVAGGASRKVETSDLPEIRKRLYSGVTLGAGLEFGGGRLRFLPEIRYVRWTSNISVPGDALRFAANEAELLAGFLF